jgi:cytochrome c oxidase subunit 1
MGGISGIMHSSPPADLQQTDTYFVVAHLHYVLFGGSILGLFAGFYYWWPKVTGRLLSERLGKLHFWTTMIAFNLTFFPQHFLGLNGMPRRIYTYSADLNFGFWNLVSTIGALMLGASVLIFMVNAILSLRRGAIAGDNPWDAATLEWSTSSPPPHYNFAVIPRVTSRLPLWDRHHPERMVDRPEDELKVVVAGKTLARTEVPDDDGESGTHHVPHMPNPSKYPVIAALGLTIAPIGVMLKPEHGIPVFLAVTLTGVLIMAYGIYSWALEPLEDH